MEESMGLLSVLRYPIEGYHKPTEMDRQYYIDSKHPKGPRYAFSRLAKHAEATRDVRNFFTLLSVGALAFIPAVPFIAVPVAALSGLLARDQARYHRHVSGMLDTIRQGQNPVPVRTWPAINGFTPPRPMPSARSLG
jgi:hypothetical protein